MEIRRFKPLLIGAIQIKYDEATVSGDARRLLTGLAAGPKRCRVWRGVCGSSPGSDGRRLETQAGRPEECSWPALAACWHGWPRAPASG